MNAALDFVIGILMKHPLALISLAAAAFGAGFGTAHWLRGIEVMEKEIVIAQERKAFAEARADAAETALEAIITANRKADELARRLADAEAARLKTSKEKDREIARLAKNKPCLGAGLVRVLNDRNQESGISGQLPAPSGLAADADRAAASDTDVALWARDARDRHDECRERIDALRDFFAK
ncbi:hypothetical protein AGMMS50256_29250 [Betaproteobacteria bacterium]|nr:hypothetical protein AGMMS50256_29250 [Betaproteobacteria bacterium]